MSLPVSAVISANEFSPCVISYFVFHLEVNIIMEKPKKGAKGIPQASPVVVLFSTEAKPYSRIRTVHARSNNTHDNQRNNRIEHTTLYQLCIPVL